MVFAWLFGSDEPEAFAYDEGTQLAVTGKIGQEWWDRPGAKRVRWVQWRKRAIVSVHCPQAATSVDCKFEDQLVKCGFAVGDDKFVLDLPLQQCVNPDKCTFYRKSAAVIELRLIKKKGSLGSWPHLVCIPGKMTKAWLSYDWDAHTEEEEEEREPQEKVKRERARFRDHMYDVESRVRNAGDPLGSFIGRDPTADHEKRITELDRFIDSTPQSGSRKHCRRLGGAPVQLRTPPRAAGHPQPQQQRSTCLPEFLQCGSTRPEGSSIHAGVATGTVAHGLGEDEVPTAAGFQKAMAEAGIDLASPVDPPTVEQAEVTDDEDVVVVQVNRRSRKSGSVSPARQTGSSPTPVRQRAAAVALPMSPPAAAPEIIHVAEAEGQNVEDALQEAVEELCGAEDGHRKAADDVLDAAIDELLH